MNFHKLGLIIQREYMTRVTTKSFILTTLLAPLLIVGVTILPILIAEWDSEVTDSIVIVDETGEVAEGLLKKNPELFTLKEGASIEELQVLLNDEVITGYLVIPSTLFEEGTKPEFVYKTGGIKLVRNVERSLEQIVQDLRLRKANIPESVNEILNDNVDLVTQKYTDTGVEEDNSLASFGFAYVMAFTIYIALFGYGATIMRSVLEEKTNRIVEIIISSVKPMELMLGKVLGVGFLGLTQLILWGAIYIGITTVLAPLLMSSMAGSVPMDAGMAAQEAPGFALPTLEVSYLLFFLLNYFLGFLMYSALFAAIGSAADSETDTQQFMTPVMIFIITPMVLLGSIATNPGSTLAISTSMFPLFSPILMIARTSISEVPLWQSGGSIILMLVTTFFLMWLSGKIYRVGILMYGKKPSFKELYKWMKY